MKYVKTETNIYYLFGQIFDKYLLLPKSEINDLKLETNNFEFLIKNKVSEFKLSPIERKNIHKITLEQPIKLINFLISNLSGCIFVYSLNKLKIKNECENYDFKEIFNKSNLCAPNFSSIVNIRCLTAFNWNFENIVFPLAFDLIEFLNKNKVFELTEEFIAENKMFKNYVLNDEYFKLDKLIEFKMNLENFKKKIQVEKIDVKYNEIIIKYLDIIKGLS